MELSCCFQIGTKKGMVVIAKDGRPKSGRIWKTKQTCRSSAKLRRGVLSHLSLSFEEKEKIREEKKYVKELEKQMKEEKRQQIEELKQRRLENAKRRAENEFKSTVYQVIKPEKLKTMSKKQLRNIKKTAVNKHGQVELINPFQKR